MVAATLESLHKFVNFCHSHIKGEERKEAQTFLDRFFRAFGHEGALEAGASYEEAIKKSSKKGKTGFADLVWKPRVLIEMKKRGEDLSKHYSQAFDYWTRLVPNRPRYVLLCNFDEFWIFDFDIQLDTPVDVIPLEQLPERAGAFAFMELGEKPPVFRNNQLVVTERAARRMGELLLELEKRKIEKLTAQRFILQCVLAMFAEDRQLLPRDMFISCVQDCMKGASSYDVLGGLFREMNQPGITPAGRYQGVDYFNGGLFSLIHGIDLTREELNFLDVSAREDWSKVRPAIFGNLFEGTVDKKERHARGIHFTSEADIMKIVRPTISRYWEERIEEATTIGELSALQLELQSYRVLDPACGSGNFLYMAYQELKRIEMLLLDKIAQRRKSANEQMQMGFVTPQQFYGMDTNPFAVELARVTLMIARKIAIDNLKLTEPALPLDTLDKNIVCQDALFSEWQKADAIIGNPPFLGGKHMRIALGDEYIDKVFQHFPDVKDSVDFCAYWFRLAHNHIDEKGRAGLVGTNSVSQGKSRIAALDYITQNGGYIHEAVSTQPWSGEAKVHVSIVNWSKELPNKYYLDNEVVSRISSSLKTTIDVSQAVRLKANLNKCFQGVIPVGEGFIVTEQQVNEWIKTDSKNQDVLKLFSMGANLAKNPHGKPERWIIDFSNMSIEEASDYELPFEHIRIYVKPEREKNREAVMREKWWRFKRTNEGMRKAIKPLSYYFAVPEVSKWAIFIPCPLEWLPGNKTKAVASDDFYIFGVLSSQVHRIWMHAQKSTLKADIAYTHNTCFETFPFPQTPDAKLVNQIRAKAEELHQYRTQQMEAKQWGITTLYNNFFNEPTSQLYKLHEQLDKLVMQAYDFNSSDDILEKLLELNLELAEKEKRGETIIGCSAPS
ncbi:class I SAM-dependent DNA methyltransferase [Scytonema hofmannii FACHB-248]|uniref:site-specific DNA-methyltransferase (adenine-specific) n=1 Tax=Scytonema hofmannii FACHB-248 TaxID=1842502 RepID=A0ABR8GIR8_9CYAN|nr:MULTISPECIES: DNA methyltransferase [Nostocales]MBD2603046.1 class I SAM-dependent DNA methyltransferase [Scytonema hofmannii FACHB-248]